MKEEMETVANAGIVDDGVPVSENMKTYGLKASDALKEQLKTDGLSNFTCIFEALIGTCNTCHRVSGHPELHMQPPTENLFHGPGLHAASIRVPRRTSLRWGSRQEVLTSALALVRPSTRLTRRHARTRRSDLNKAATNTRYFRGSVPPCEVKNHDLGSLLLGRSTGFQYPLLGAPRSDER